MGQYFSLLRLVVRHVLSITIIVNFYLFLENNVYAIYFLGTYFFVCEY